MAKWWAPRGRHAKKTRFALVTAIAIFVIATIGHTVVGDAWHSAVKALEPAKTTSPLAVQQVPADLIAEVKRFDAGQFVIPKTVDQLQRVRAPKSSSDSDFAAWAEKQGGVQGATRLVGIQLNSAIAEPIAITGVTARVLKRQKPLSGTVVSVGAGYLGIHTLNVDLDAPKMQALPNQGDPWHFPLQVGHGSDAEVFGVFCSTHESDVRFVVDVAYIYKDKIQNYEVTDNGKPFEVTAILPGQVSPILGNPSPDGNATLQGS